MTSLKELLKQNKYITKIDGEYYDVTNFVPEHPGGDILLGLCNGNDATAMFHSSHFKTPSLNYPSIKKVKILENTTVEVNARKVTPDKFLDSLKKEIHVYFKKNNIKYNKPALKGYLVLYSLLFIFFNLMYLSYVQGKVIYSLLMGIITWNFAGTIVHDHGMHRFLVNRKNELGVWFWSTIQIIVFPFTFDAHVLSTHLGHHSGIHNKELDADDWLLYPMVRLSKHMKHRWWHKYQHFYWPIGYSLYLFFYVAKANSSSRSTNWWKRHNHSYRAIHNSRFYYLVLVLFLVHFILPMYCLGIVQGFFNYLVFLLTYSIGAFFLATISHTIVNDKYKKENDNSLWSYETVSHSADFMTGSFFAYLIAGGFNLHGIHHLLPSIHPSHLLSIYPIYKRKCEEYNYPLVIIESWGELFRRFHHYLYLMGRSEENVATIEKKIKMDNNVESKKSFEPTLSKPQQKNFQTTTLRMFNDVKLF